MQELITKYKARIDELTTYINAGWPEDGEFTVDPEFYDNWIGARDAYRDIVKDLEYLNAGTNSPVQTKEAGNQK